MFRVAREQVAPLVCEVGQLRAYAGQVRILSALSHDHRLTCGFQCGPALFARPERLHEARELATARSDRLDQSAQLALDLGEVFLDLVEPVLRRLSGEECERLVNRVLDNCLRNDVIEQGLEDEAVSVVQPKAPSVRADSRAASV